MSSDKWKAIVVFPHPLQDDVPSFDCVALFAVGPHLATMDVSMAVRTVRSRVREHRLGVALRTSHSLMQAA